MEEYFFQHYSQGDEVLWFDGEVLPLPAVDDQYHGSSFVKYSNHPLQGFGSNGRVNHGKNDRNANKRMIELLKKRWKPPTIGAVEAERERNRKHVINERMRRGKQKKSFVELHKMLPYGTKGDKNSIVQMAAERIHELQRCNEELKRRKIELELALAAAIHDDEENLEVAKIKLRVVHPSSGIDSMLEVLKCLKNTGTKTKGIQSTFSSQEFSAVLEIEAKGAAEVEKAVHETLFEAEKKFRCPVLFD
ncbi:transcription factor bHLH92-like isoform X2 [Coffea arabica]|uniref:Transcription factor bHLH92-like isoform X2 n=1 Tax=Coffea arabica TaxID=13443 RepID=A0ABM4X934_COFAR